MKKLLLTPLLLLLLLLSNQVKAEDEDKVVKYEFCPSGSVCNFPSRLSPSNLIGLLLCGAQGPRESEIPQIHQQLSILAGDSVSSSGDDGFDNVLSYCNPYWQSLKSVYQADGFKEGDTLFIPLYICAEISSEKINYADWVACSDPVLTTKLYDSTGAVKFYESLAKGDFLKASTSLNPGGGLVILNYILFKMKVETIRQDGTSTKFPASADERITAIMSSSPLPLYKIMNLAAVYPTKGGTLLSEYLWADSLLRVNYLLQRLTSKVVQFDGTNVTKLDAPRDTLARLESAKIEIDNNFERAIHANLESLNYKQAYYIKVNELEKNMVKDAYDEGMSGNIGLSSGLAKQK